MKQLEEKLFFKVVCESVSVWGKEILVDQNCSSIDEVHSIIKDYPQFMSQDKTWVVYPMGVTS